MNTDRERTSDDEDIDELALEHKPTETDELPPDEAEDKDLEQLREALKRMSKIAI